MNKPTIEAVHLDTLRLLQETVDYLERLPVVPMTYQLCKKIEDHLADPNVMTVKRHVLEVEETDLIKRRNSKAGSYSPAGLLLYEAEVDTESVTVRISEHLPCSERAWKSLQKGRVLNFL